jgi:hypothetical protein
MRRHVRARSVRIIGMKRWIAAALVVAGFVAGCYRSTPPPEEPAPPRPMFQEPQPSSASFRSTRPPPPARSLISEAIAKLAEFADDMCACTDKPCADAVQSEMTRWSTEISQRKEDYDKPTEEEVEEVTKVSQRLSTCTMTAMGYGSPPPPTP